MATDIKKLKELMSQYKNIRNYTDGGKVESDDDVLTKAKEIFNKAFGTPTPTSPPKPSLEEQYEKTRQQNYKNFGYAEGGEVKKDPPPELDPQKLAEAQESLRKAFHFFGGGEVPHLFNGGRPVDTELEGSIFSEPKKLSSMELPQDTDTQMIESPYKSEELAANINSPSSMDELQTIEEPTTVEEEVQSSETKDEEAPTENEDETDSSQESVPQQMPEQKLVGQEVPKAEEQAPEQQSFSKLLSSLKPSSQANELAEAQRQRDQNIALNQMQRGAAIAGGGMAKADPGQILKSIEAQEKYSGLPVEKYAEKIANQKNDPNSSVSQAYRQFYEKVTGQKPQENWSAADLEKVSPLFEKYMQAKETAQAKKETKQADLEYKRERDKEMLDLRKEQIKGNIENKRQMLELMGNKNATLHYDRNTNKFQTWQKTIMTDPLIKTMGQSQLRAKRMFVSNGLPPNLTPEQVKNIPNKQLDQRTMLNVMEDAIQLNKLLSETGIPSEKITHGLIPGNIETFRAQMQEKLGSHPSPAKQGAFIKQYLGISAGINQLYNEEIRKRQDIIARGANAFADTHGQDSVDVLNMLGIDTDFMKTQGPKGLERYKEKIPTNFQSQSSNVSKQINKDQLKAYSQKHNIDEQKARDLLTKGGYQVE